ncbi:MAG: hypothetical protein SFU85_04465 [Candidatus Methylacidiphilales bacterium]|nr:hypothetical protein [Candidatus Methylacidiphilales bacterium]
MPFLLAFLVASMVACLPLQAAPAPDFLNAPLWDGGKAELTLYQAREIRYGTARDCEVRLITVKEPWNDRLGVKADGNGDREVIKLNQIVSVPTGTYRYEQMHSLFLDRKTGRALKFSYSHHDACGNTFKMGRFLDNILTFTWHTYWDGEGDGVQNLPWSETTHLYEELPLRVRMWASEGKVDPSQITLLNPQMNSRLGKPATATARVQVSAAGGEFHYTVTHDNGKDLLVVDNAFPHTLRSWTRADGATWTLRKTLMLDYWNKNQSGDEKWLK